MIQIQKKNSENQLDHRLPNLPVMNKSESRIPQKKAKRKIEREKKKKKIQLTQ
jgi:hypothetical protein